MSGQESLTITAHNSLSWRCDRFETKVEEESEAVTIQGLVESPVVLTRHEAQALLAVLNTALWKLADWEPR